NPTWAPGSPPWLRLRRLHSEDGPRAHEYVRLLRSVIDEYPDRVLIGEVVLPPARAVAFHGARLNEAHLPHNFALTHLRSWTAAGARSPDRSDPHAVVGGSERRLLGRRTVAAARVERSGNHRRTPTGRSEKHAYLRPRVDRPAATHAGARPRFLRLTPVGAGRL